MKNLEVLNDLDRDELEVKLLAAYDTIRKLNRRAQKSESVTVKLADRFAWENWSWIRHEGEDYHSWSTYAFAERIVSKIMPGPHVTIERLKKRIMNLAYNQDELLRAAKDRTRLIWQLRGLLANYKGSWKEDAPPISQAEIDYFKHYVEIHSRSAKCQLCDGTGKFMGSESDCTYCDKTGRVMVIGKGTLNNPDRWVE